jgi:hypothetical protein
MDSNFQYASTVRWHRATDLPLPPTVKRRSAGRPPPMARPRSEAQRGSVRPAAAMRSTHREMRCSAAVQAARYRAARRAAMRSAHCEIRPGENVTLQYLSHDGSPGPPPCEPPPPHLRQRQNPCRSIGGQYSRSWVNSPSPTAISNSGQITQARSKARSVARSGVRLLATPQHPQRPRRSHQSRGRHGA